jgi:hypothetical protein
MSTLSRLLTVLSLLLFPACNLDEKAQVERPADAQGTQAMPAPEAKVIQEAQEDVYEVKPEVKEDKAQSEPIVPRDKKTVHRKPKRVDSPTEEAKQQAASVEAPTEEAKQQAASVEAPKEEAKQQAASVEAPKEEASAEADPVFKGHTISLLIGHDRLGTKDFDLRAVQKDGLLFGAQYAYHWSQEWSTLGMVTSKDSLMAGAGYSFAEAHTISLLIGHGRLGTRDFDLKAAQKDGLLFGAQYAYNWSQEWSMLGMVTSEDSIMAGAGYSFDL